MVKSKELQNCDILYNHEQLGPYPDHLLKRVDEPTAKITAEMHRRDPREHALNLARRGDYGEKVKEFAPQMTVSYPLGASLVDILENIISGCLKRVRVAAKKTPVPDDPRVLSRHIKSMAYFLGADHVGICELPPSAVYSHSEETGKPINLDYKYAIVFLLRKDKRTTDASNGYDWIFDPLSFQVYQILAVQTETMANYIRRLGYDAYPSHVGTYVTLMPELVIRAGLGEVSRAGIALNPFFGLNFKAAAVLTDLPLEVDKPIDFGLQDYCRDCYICAEQCPSKAVSFQGKALYNGYETYKLDERACASFCILNREGWVCGRCTKVCPWNRPEIEPHHFAGWDGDMQKIYDDVNRQAERIKNNNYKESAELTGKWWFPWTK